MFNRNLYDKQENKPKFVNQMQITKRILTKYFKLKPVSNQINRQIGGF